MMGAITALASICVLAAHLVAMNLASAAPLICVWLRYRENRGDVAADAVGRQLAYWSLWSLLVGTALGVILLGILWATPDEGYWLAVARFPTQAYGFAAGELAFTAACLALYAGLWNRLRGHPWWHALLAVLATTNLFYHFPPLMIALGELSAQPEWVSDATITRPVFRGLLTQPELVGKVVHFGFASVAVSGATLMLLARWRPSSETVEGDRDPFIRAGAAIALAASIAQLAIGIWVLLQLPTTSRNALMGDDWLASLLFLLSIVAVFGALRALASVAIGDTDHLAVRRSAILLASVVVLMTGSLVRSRHVQRMDSPVLNAAIKQAARQRTFPRPLTVGERLGERLIR